MAEFWEKDPTEEEWWAEDQPTEAVEPVRAGAVPTAAPPTAAPAGVPPIPEPREMPVDLSGRTLRGLGQLGAAALEGAPLGYGEEIGAVGSTIAGQLGIEGFSPEYQENLEHARRILGDIQPGVRTTGNILGALATGGALGAPRSLAQAAGMGAGTGAVAGSGFAEGGLEERLAGAGTGAATGAVLGPAVYGAANIVAPRVSQALQTLRREGVRPTVGQMMGGAAGRLEESAQSIPVMGQMIRGARTRALEDFNRGAVNFALRPAGLSVGSKTSVGRQTIAEADELLSKGYDEALEVITDASIDPQFQQDISRIATNAQQRLGSKGARAFQNAIDDIRSLPFMKNPTFTGKEVKRAISGLRQDADRLAKNVDEDVTQAGTLVREARDALSDLMKRNTTPDNAARLTGLDRAYAGFQRVRSASEAGREGLFTPFQYSQAIKRAEKATGSRSFARGEGMGQELAQAAEEVISSRVPDSGTPERLAPYLIGAAGGAGYISPAAGAGIAAGVAPYTRTGQNILAALATRQPSRGAQVLAENLRRAAVPAAVGGASVTQ